MKYKDGTEWQEGDFVYFEVENNDMWAASHYGHLAKENGEWVVNVRGLGITTIGKGYDIYASTIRKIQAIYT